MTAGPAISQSRSQDVSSRNMAAVLAESTPPKATSSGIARGPGFFLRVADPAGQETAELLLGRFREQAEVTFQRGEHVIGGAFPGYGHPDQPEGEARH